MKLAIARRIKRRTEAQNGVNRWVCTSAKNKEKKKTKKLLTRPTSLEMYRKREGQCACTSTVCSRAFDTTT
jgi:hypothetical protein